MAKKKQKQARPAKSFGEALGINNFFQSDIFNGIFLCMQRRFPGRKRISVFHSDIQIIAEYRQRSTDFFKRDRSCFLFFRQLPASFPQFFKFIGPGKNPRPFGRTTARHGSSDVDHLPVKRNNAVAVTAVPGNTDGIGKGFPTKVSDPITPQGVWCEGPAPLFVGDTLYVYFDMYRDHRYGVVRSLDHGKTWSDVSHLLHMPQGIRHGTAFCVDERYLTPLLHLHESAPSSPTR